MSPLTTVLNFITPTATGVRPVRALSRHLGCALVRGVLGLTEPTRLSSLHFSRQCAEIFSSVLRDIGPNVGPSTVILPPARKITPRHGEVCRFQSDDESSSLSEPPDDVVGSLRGNEQPTIVTSVSTPVCPIS